MTNPRLRQVVLIAPELDPALDEARGIFGFTGGVRDEQGMADLGFVHEVFSFGDTFLEIVAPTVEDSPQGRLAARGGSGYMVVVQVDGLEGAVARADALGFAPLLHEEYEGQMISQWHPKDLGTIAELDEVTPAESWHFAPEIFEHRSTGVARDIAGATLAVGDPEKVARTWAELVQGAVEGDTVRLGGGTLRFVPTGEGPRGLREVEVVAADPARIGDVVTLCGVGFRFVEEAAR